VHAARVIAGEVKCKASEFIIGQMTRDIDLSARLAADVQLLAATDEITDETSATPRICATRRSLTCSSSAFRVASWLVTQAMAVPGTPTVVWCSDNVRVALTPGGVVCPAQSRYQR
jgi:hypothetical protein